MGDGVFRIVSKGRYYYTDIYGQVTVDKGVIQTETPWYFGSHVWDV